MCVCVWIDANEIDVILTEAIDRRARGAGLLRCGKSCRLRWINYLRPDLKRGNFTEEEDELIIKFHELFGNK
jgi:hypothetical protein